jgi:two-component system, chemotaxis family, chemotaxis protein CheY
VAKRVLIIDDSSDVRRQVCGALAGAGFEMLEAVNGVDGAAQIRQQPDLALIICDINMPQMNGLDMLENVQDELARRQIPVVMLTTEGKADLMARARKAGAKGWIVKPFQDHLFIAADAVAQLTQ